MKQIRYLGTNQHKVQRPWYLSSWMTLYFWFALIAILFIWTHTFSIGMDHLTIVRNHVDLPVVKSAHAQTVAGKSAELATPTPTPTNAEMVIAAKHGDIIMRIWTLESGRGNQPLLRCTRRGMVSDMGFGALDGVCFDSFQEEVTRVDRWLDEHLNEHPLANTLCIYNTGVDTGDCDYARNFLGI